MGLTSALIVILIFQGITCVEFNKDKKLFDTLVFEQHWPVCKDTIDCPFTNIDGARFVTDAVFVMNRSKGLPVKNCHSQNHTRLNITKLMGMDEDLDFTWPNWPKKLFKRQLAIEEEWNRYASCFMDFMKLKEIFMDEEEFFEQVISWYTEFQFTEQLKQYRIIPGSTVYIDRLYHGLRTTTGQRGQPRIDCKVAKNQYGMIEVEWRKVALCFNVSTLAPVDCGNLYGGYRGSCPKFFAITYPYPLPRPTKDISPFNMILNINHSSMFERESMFMIMILVLIICFICHKSMKK